ncbi:hypothetical protein AMTR_s00029p00147460 [Amborella trichopoda]|uniref:DEP domain-containing protein n=2 Tax=Amborella trichopoda TaxID=13333 RepID=W1PN99_AMBTC|nr:hypothetical protein AMTR_s00029p00147460 [Amborella trichopoda]
MEEVAKSELDFPASEVPNGSKAMDSRPRTSDRRRVSLRDEFSKSFSDSDEGNGEKSATVCEGSLINGIMEVSDEKAPVENGFDGGNNKNGVTVSKEPSKSEPDEENGAEPVTKARDSLENGENSIEECKDRSLERENGDETVTDHEDRSITNGVIETHSQKPLTCDNSSDEENDKSIRHKSKSLDYRNEEKLLKPHSWLPQPEVPQGLLSEPKNRNKTPEPQTERSISETRDMPSFGKFIKERSNSLSSAIVKRISSLKDSEPDEAEKISTVKQFNLTGLKVIVQLKAKEPEFKGRIAFFSRSNCRDCSAVRAFFREKALNFVEINIDVYPSRENELLQRTGSSSVPQIFFNEQLFGGLVALNSLRNSGQFERRLLELTAGKCPPEAPQPPVYGFDDPDEEHKQDELLGIARVLRQKLPIQDRIMKMKIVKNCFSGGEAVEVLIQHMDCGRKKAIEMGKQLARKHFFHHVFQENDFEDGNHFYRFLEHEPTIPKCFNFRGCTNDDEPESAQVVGKKLNKIMSAILEAYATDDRCNVDYHRISNSEEFRRYANLVQDLQRTDILALKDNQRLAFFLNLYNAMVIHAVIRIGEPGGVIDRRTFFGEFQYIVGGYPYSLSAIKNGILRGNRRQPYTLARPFHASDKRLEASLPKLNPLIHFGLCNATRSSPTVRFFSAEGIEAELRYATREFFHGDGMAVNLEKRTVYLTRIMKWFSADFGQEREILNWVLNYTDATKAGLLTHLLSDGAPINIVYQDFDWSLNS